MMTSLGMSAADAPRAGRCGPRSCSGLAGTAGVIEPGAAADIVAVALATRCRTSNACSRWSSLSRAARSSGADATSPAAGARYTRVTLLWWDIGAGAFLVVRSPARGLREPMAAVRFAGSKEGDAVMTVSSEQPMLRPLGADFVAEIPPGERYADAARGWLDGVLAARCSPTCWRVCVLGQSPGQCIRSSIPGHWVSLASCLASCWLGSPTRYPGGRCSSPTRHGSGCSAPWTSRRLRPRCRSARSDGTGIRATMVHISA